MKKITLLFFTVLLSTPFLQAQVSLVKDINQGPGDGIAAYPENRIAFNNQLLFAGNDGSSGMELWTTDGTEPGTQILHTTNSLSGSGNPRAFFEFNGLIYFSSIEANNGDELYSTDGTSSGITSYPEMAIFSDSSPRNFVEYNNNLVFTSLVQDNSLNGFGRELLGFNGAPWTGDAGVPIMIKDIHVGGSSNPDNYTKLNGSLYFAATATGTGREIWISDGTNSGTNILLDINSGLPGSDPSDFTLFNNKIYFTADNGGVNGRELWVTDGTTSGTQMVFDLYSGGIDSNPTDLMVFNNALYFAASHPTLGREIFKMTVVENITSLKNIASANGSSNPGNLFVSNGRLYFSADDGTNGIELWSSTGFSSTTNMLKNINTDAATPDSNPSGFAEYFGELYFKANDGVNGIELWKTDGTNAGTVLVEDINTSGDSNPSDLTVANNILFFSADNGATGRELFKYQDPSLSIETIELEREVTLFPNPSRSNFSIATNYNINAVIVYDIQGKLVKNFEGYLEQYAIEELTSGMYFVNVKTDKGQVTHKLIKE